MSDRLEDLEKSAKEHLEKIRDLRRSAEKEGLFERRIKELGEYSLPTPWQIFYPGMSFVTKRDGIIHMETLRMPTKWGWLIGNSSGVFGSRYLSVDASGERGMLTLYSEVCKFASYEAFQELPSAFDHPNPLHRIDVTAFDRDTGQWRHPEFEYLITEGFVKGVMRK